MRNLRRIRPSPSMVVASIALLVALAGTSVAAVTALPNNSVGTAQLKSNAVTSAKIKNGQVQPADLSASAKTSGPQGPAGPTGAQGAKGDNGASATALWASVNSAGTLVRNKGVASALKIGTGQYQVLFNQDVTGCSYQATLGGPTTDFGIGQITAAQRGGGLPAGVSVLTINSAGTALADSSFFLAVFC